MLLASAVYCNTSSSPIKSNVERLRRHPNWIYDIALFLLSLFFPFPFFLVSFSFGLAFAPPPSFPPHTTWSLFCSLLHDIKMILQIFVMRQKTIDIKLRFSNFPYKVSRMLKGLRDVASVQFPHLIYLARTILNTTIDWRRMRSSFYVLSIRIWIQMP